MAYCITCVYSQDKKYKIFNSKASLGLYKLTNTHIVAKYVNLIRAYPNHAPSPLGNMHVTPLPGNMVSYTMNMIH